MHYFIIFLLLAAYGINHFKYQNKPIRVHVYICFAIFVLLAGLRYEIGIDYFAYQKSYTESENIFKLLSFDSHFLDNIFSGWEPGMILLMGILKLISDDPQILFFTTSLICTFLLFKSLKYFSEPKYIFLSLLIYFCFVYMYQEMHALRQAIGASIFYYGLIYLGKGYKRKAIITTLIASCFHYSILLFIPILIFLDRPLKIKFQLLCIFLSFIIFVLRIPWMNVFLNNVIPIIPVQSIGIKLIGYMTREEFTRPFYITFILYLLPYLLMLHRDKKELFQERKLVIAQNLYFLYLIFTMIFWEYAYFSIRYGWICLFGMAICLPNLISSFKNRLVPLIYVVIFCFIPIRTFLFPDIITSQFSPYENYISVKVLGKKSTGKDRVEQVLQHTKSLRSI